MVHRRVAECFLKDLGLNKEAGHCAWVARRGCYPRLFSLPPHPRCPCSVARLCPTLGYRVDYSVQGFPVLHYLPEFSYSCPLSWWWHSTVSSSVTCFSSSPQSFPASGSFPMSQHQVVKGLEFQLQHQSFQWTFRVDFLWDRWVWSPCSLPLFSLSLTLSFTPPSYLLNLSLFSVFAAIVVAAVATDLVERMVTGTQWQQTTPKSQWLNATEVSFLDAIANPHHPDHCSPPSLRDPAVRGTLITKAGVKRQDKSPTRS